MAALPVGLAITDAQGGSIQANPNLIGNALKFCKSDEPPIVRVQSHKLPDQWIEITIEDNGIGIELKLLLTASQAW